MLRNILRTSQWLARRQINIISQIALRRYSYLLVRKPSIITCHRRFSTNPPNPEVGEVEPAVFEDICNETLESLYDYFEEIIEGTSIFKGADVTYSDGVLTVALGPSFGTYVINRQTPNKQIWLSSPISGPKRYDLVLKDGGYWVYKHDGMTLHQLLQKEISDLVESKLEFSKCAHSFI